MAAGIFQRAFGGKKNSLEVDLGRITESGVIEIPKELLDVVVEAAVGEDERREIMRHLRECLTEPAIKRWRRVYAGLVLVEELAKRGPPALLVETAQGHHFDLVQRLSLLEHFENTGDRRVQNMVRTKATALRAEMVTRLQAAGDEAPLQSGGDAIKDTASTCSPGITSNASCSTSGTGSSSTSPSGTAPARPEGRMVLNGIVTVGHSDDTTDEEDSDDDGPRKAVQYKQRKERRNKKRTGHGSESEDDGRGPQPAEKAAPAPAPPAPALVVDLLEL
mmetsp:Transcript_71108/g.179537  ORF Transcript_71108/g.179537 Transcript_71108/m.179537 type:complete len:277 (-) Transcript_71108:106-936(-)